MSTLSSFYPVTNDKGHEQSQTSCAIWRKRACDLKFTFSDGWKTTKPAEMAESAPSILR
jgi:hypothetical protein